MSIEADLFADLNADEGNRLIVYDDATGMPICKGSTLKGNPTIGRGRNLWGSGISPAESDALLKNDISETLGWCSRFLPWFADLTDMRKRAVANMVFNMGGKTFLTFTKFIGDIKSGDFGGAAAEIMDSDAARENPVRYKRLYQRMLAG